MTASHTAVLNNKVPNQELVLAYAKIKKREEVAQKRVLAAMGAFVVALFIVTCIIRSFTLQTEVLRLQSQLKEANSTIAEQESYIEELEGFKETSAAIPTLTELVKLQSEVITSVINDNVELSDEYTKVSNAYDTLKDRKELYDKYAYALEYNGSRTDLTYDQAKYAEELMNEYGLDPDLLFSIGMVESRYDEDAANKSSTALGYHQILSGTGNFIWKKILCNTSSYSHSIALDGYTNIELAAAYLNYLNDYNSNNLFATISTYSGRTSEDTKSYIAEMNRFLSTKDKSVASIQVALNK